jgi:hypothetical protein
MAGSRNKKEKRERFLDPDEAWQHRYQPSLLHLRGNLSRFCMLIQIWPDRSITTQAAMISMSEALHGSM